MVEESSGTSMPAGMTAVPAPNAGTSAPLADTATCAPVPNTSSEPAGSS